MKRTRLIAIIIFLVIALAIAYITLEYTKEGNALIATYFVKNEGTYKFDGIPETFKLNLNGSKNISKYSWEFVFEYQSRNSGYGDRKNVIVNPVITNHYAKIVMENGTIKSALLDNEWDMKNQKIIEPVPERRPG